MNIIYKENNKIKICLSALFCAMAVFMSTYNYYSYIVNSLTRFFSIVYQACKFFFIVLFILQMFLVLAKKRKFNKNSLPFLFILIFVFLNILVIILKTKSIAILQLGYYMKIAEGTNDKYGYYLSLITTWTANCGLGIWIANNVKKKNELNKCINVTLVMLMIPIILLLIFHPEIIGQRTSTLDDINFGGGVWNIGVFGFASIAWLAISQKNNMSKKNKRLVNFVITILIFSGIIGLSRSFILMLGVSFIYYFMKMKKTEKSIFNAILISVVIIIMFILLIISHNSILFSILGRMSDNTSGTHNVRILLWKEYLMHIKEYFLIGAPEGRTI